MSKHVIQTMHMSPTLDDVPERAPEPKEPMALWAKIVITLFVLTTIVCAVAAFFLGMPTF